MPLNTRFMLGLLHVHPQASVRIKICAIARAKEMAQLLKARLTGKMIKPVTWLNGIMKDHRTVSVVDPTGRLTME